MLSYRQTGNLERDAWIEEIALDHEAKCAYWSSCGSFHIHCKLPHDILSSNYKDLQQWFRDQTGVECYLEEWRFDCINYTIFVKGSTPRIGSGKSVEGFFRDLESDYPEFTIDFARGHSFYSDPKKFEYHCVEAGITSVTLMTGTYGRAHGEWSGRVHRSQFRQLMTFLYGPIKSVEGEINENKI